MDAEPVGSVFCGGSRLAEPQVQHVEGTWSQSYGAERSSARRAHGGGETFLAGRVVAEGVRGRKVRYQTGESLSRIA